jgi:hypothetical protein
MRRPDRVIVSAAFTVADPTCTGRQPAGLDRRSRTFIGCPIAFAIIFFTTPMSPSRFR